MYRALPHALWFRTLPPCRGRLWRCHVPHGSGPRLPTREGSGGATCPTAPDPISLLRRALVLPRAPRLRTPPPCLGGLQYCHLSHSSEPYLHTQCGGLRCCHVSCNPQGAADIQNKERLSYNDMKQGTHISKTRPRVNRGGCKTCGQMMLFSPTNHADMCNNTVL
jgi:hypothetical protein